MHFSRQCKMGQYSLIILALLSALVAGRDLEWWEGGNFYQIYPRSFKDSNGDGIGDLLGIASKVQYLKDIGMDGVWLSPIMKSPQADYGYDISDYRDISPEYGTLADFETLLAECQRVGIRLVLDLVPNHSSNEHDWFIKSENREPGYENYYIWHPGTFDPLTGKHVPPNNWVSVFRFPSWTWSDKRKQFYYHAFLYQQPDLNYRNPKIMQEMKDVISYWYTKGVSGFRIDAVPYLFEVNKDFDGNFPDEPLTGDSCPNPDDYCHTQHIYTQDRDETFDMIYQWRELSNEFSKLGDGTQRVLMTEAYTSLDNMIKFYGDGQRDGSHIPFNFEVISNVNEFSTAKDYKTRIDNWLNRVPAGKYANWVLGNHDQHRMASRLGVERTDLLNIMLQTLPGIAVTYQGEELGLLNTHVSWEDTRDQGACNTNPEVYEQYSRDGCRTPFPWDTSAHGGFSNTTGDTWLPINPDYVDGMNVAAQETSDNSHLKIFKRLTKLRTHNVLLQGEYKSKLANDDNVIVSVRKYESDWAVVILNFGSTEQIVNVISEFSDETTLPSTLAVYAASLDTLATASIQDLTQVTVQADKAVVLSTVTYESLTNLTCI